MISGTGRVRDCMEKPKVTMEFPKTWNSSGVEVDTKPDHALCFATESLRAVGRMGAD